MARPLSGKSAPKGSRTALDRFTPQSERQFNKPVEAASPSPVEPVAPKAKPTVAPKAKAKPTGVDVFAAQEEKVKQEQVEKDIKAYAIRKAQREAAAKLAQRKK